LIFIQGKAKKCIYTPENVQKLTIFHAEAYNVDFNIILANGFAVILSAIAALPAFSPRLNKLN